MPPAYTPTRFPGGVNDQPITDPFGKMGMLDPTKWIVFWNDFVNNFGGLPLGASGIADNSDWDVTITEAGGGSASVAFANGSGGLILITNDAFDNDAAFFRKIPEAFRWASNKRLYFEIRFKISEATQSDFIAGLMLTDTTPLDVTDGIFFQKDDGDANLDFHVEKDNAASDATAFATITADTFTVLSFYYDPERRLFYCYKDNIKLGTLVSTNAPDDVDLSVTFGIQNGDANARSMTLDYILCALER